MQLQKKDQGNRGKNGNNVRARMMNNSLDEYASKNSKIDLNKSFDMQGETHISISDSSNSS